MDYWRECIDIAFDEAGIVATEEQKEYVSGVVEGGSENYGMAHGYDCIKSPVEDEKDRKIKRLEAEILDLKGDIEIYNTSVARRHNISPNDVYLERYGRNNHGEQRGAVMVIPQ